MTLIHVANCKWLKTKIFIVKYYISTLMLLQYCDFCHPLSCFTKHPIFVNAILIVTYNSNLYQTKPRIICKQPAAMFLLFFPQKVIERQRILHHLFHCHRIRSSQLDCHKLLYIYISTAHITSHYSNIINNNIGIFICFFHPPTLLA